MLNASVDRDKELSTQKAFFRELFEISPEAIVLLDQNHKIIDINKEFERLFQYSLNELKGKNVDEIIVPKHRKEEAKTLTKNVLNKQRVFKETVRKRKDGTLVDVSVLGAPIIINDKEIGVYGIYRDITEEKRLEREREIQRQELEAIFNAIPDLFFLLDRNGTFLDYKVQDEKKLYVDPEDFLGKTHYDIFPPELADKFDRALKKIVRTHQPTSIEYCLPLQENIPLYFEMRYLPLSDGNIASFVRDITQRKLSEKRLQESEEKYRKLTNQSLTGIYIYQDNHFVFVNPTLAKITGYSTKELLEIENPIAKIVHPEFLRLVSQRAEKRLKGEEVVSTYEYKIITKHGEGKWVYTSSTFINYNGERAILANAIDITDLKNAEARLRESSEKYKVLFEQSNDAIFIMKDGIFIECNQKTLEMFGCDDRNQIVGNPPYYFSPEFQPDGTKSAVSARQRIQSALDKGSQYFYWKHKKLDGTLFDAEVSLSHIEIGEEKYIQAIVRDITERKKAEDRLAEQKERLMVTLRSIGDGVITTDIHGKIELMNKVAVKLTGWTLDEAKGRDLTEVFYIVDELTGETLENPAEIVLREKKIVGLSNRTVLIAKDGQRRIIADSGAPILDRNSEIVGVVLVFRDETAKREVERELIKAQRLESVGILAGGIAHDFNNILTGIMGNITLSKIEAEESSNLYEYLIQAEKTVLQAKGLTEQLLTFSKGGSPVKTLISLKELVKDSLEFSLRGSNVAYEMNVQEDIWDAEIDPGQIGQVINNLAINSVQAMPDGGKIQVAMKNVTVTPQNPIGTLREGNYIEFQITDEGVGIREKDLPKIFNPYFSTKEDGTGLGLATCYSIIKNHDGIIQVESIPKEGSTFTFYLPASSQKAKEDELEHEVSDGCGKILIMDDQKVIRTTLKKIFEKVGYQVETAEEGHQAIQKYKKATSEENPFDLVILDLTIPGGLGGLDTFTTLKMIDPNVVAVVTSGYSTDPVLSEPRKFGFYGTLKKPFKMDEAMKLIKDILEETNKI